MGIQRDLQGPFVGRSGELACLAALRRESHRYGRFALVAGEPGIGKSRLAKEFLRDVPRSRAAIGIGRALEHVRSPFAPWISALEDVAPDAARIIRPNGASSGDKATMYATVVASLRQCAQRRSVILLLEDLHWADAGSLELLQVLLAELTSLRRLLVIGTVRSSEAHETVRCVSTNAQSTVFELQPLGLRECVELVQALLADDLQSTRVERIASLSGGNPFFAIELSKHTAAGDIPLTLSSAIEARLTSMSEPDVQALEAAAVLGEDFALQLLVDILGCDASAAAARLEPAQRAGIVVEDTGGRFHFAHALTRAVLASHLTSAQRIDLHRRAAKALEHRQHFDAFGFAQLAYHHAGAHEYGQAYAYRMRAGALAYNVHAYVDAASFYADAASCADPGSLERARALARQGDALLRATNLEDAEVAYRSAIAIYRASGAVEEPARLYQGLAHSLYNRDRAREALALIQHAIAELSPLPPEINDDLCLHGALYAGDLAPETGIRWLERVNEESVKNTRSGGSYYAIGAAVHASLGDVDTWRRNAEAFQRNVAVVQPDGAYIGHFGNLAANALFLGLPAMPLYEQCFALARTMKMEVYEAAYASHAALERWLHGDEEAFARFAAFASAHDAPMPALHAYVLLNSMLGDSSFLPPAREVEVLVAGGHNEFFGPLVGTYARRLARKGDVQGARRILDAAAERLEVAYAAWETLTAMVKLGSVKARARAEALIEPHRGSAAPAFAATAAMVRALGAARDGDVHERDRAASQAGTIYAAMGWVHHQRRASELGVKVAQPRFSDRELQIARLLQEGCSNRAMAGELFISEKTVEKHLARLYEKLEVSNRAAAVRALTQHKLTE